jgi:cytoskeletal protein CcmA (bactofilin family)
MLGFNRSTDLRDGVKAPLKPALYDPPGAPAKAVATAPPARPAPAALPPAPARDAKAAPHVPAHDGTAHALATATTAEYGDVTLTDAPGSKLFIGVNIKLKGVEISDCDVLVIEGEVDATVHSKLMQIASPGTLHGTALIDVAEIHGEFAGELTARTRLVIHGTGRVSGTIRYGKLIVAEGGELSGDVKRLDSADEQAQRSLLPAGHPRHDPPAGAGPGWAAHPPRPG